MPRSSQHCRCACIDLPIALGEFLRAVGILPLTLMLLCLVSFATSSYAQATSATLTLTLEDPQGALVSGADVVLSSTAQGTQRSGTTNSEGAIVFVLVPPGTYSLTITATGFAPREIKQVVLNVNDQRDLKVQLSLGHINQTVEIVDGASLINESAAIGTTVNRQFIENIPANGRSFQNLITLSPGVALTKASIAEQGQFSVNGQRADANYFMIDGVGANIGVSPGNNAGQSTAGALPGVATTGGTNNLVSMDALQEFKILTSSYSPEFGRTPGGQVSIVTRSGTNQFRGTIFEYFRNDALDAKDWFTNQTGQPKPALRQNDFGGVLGGPLHFPRFGEGGPFFYDGKNRTFFFFSYEGLRLRLPQTQRTLVPSVAARQAAPVAMRPFLDAFPRPNSQNLSNNFSEFNASYSDPSTLDATSLRIDHVVNSRLTFFARYNYSPSESVQRGTSGRSLSSISNTTIKTQTLTAGATMIFNPTTNNDFRVNYSKNEGELGFTADDFGGAAVPPDSILFPSPFSSSDALFILALGFTGSPGWWTGRVQTDWQRQFNVVDSLSLVRGRHQLKFGVDYRRLFPIFDRVGYTQNPVFNGVNGAVTGRATLVIIQAFSGPRFPVFNNLSLFAQDNWKLGSRLLLTYGTRWELNPAPSEASGKEPFAITSLDNLATIAVAPAGTPLFKTRYNNFAPRVGVAYHVSQANGRETILRGGFGVFYDLGIGTVASAYGAAFPFLRSTTVAAAVFPLSGVSAAPPPFNPNPPFSSNIAGVVDPNFKLPYTYQWNAAIEQSLGFNQVVSVSYVAAVGRRLARQEVIPPPAPGFRSLFATRNSATSDYHALQLQLQRRLFNGLQYVTSYTWSHSIDNASTDSSFEAPVTRIDPAQERGPSDFDIRHSLTGAVTYDVPVPFHRGVGNLLLRNFSVDTIFTARSATPVNVLTGANPVGGGIGVFRPDLIEGVPLYIEDSTVAGGRRINPAAFKVPVGRQGTLGRNVLRGFPAWQIDFAVRRRFQLTEQVNLQLRAEFFNIFNHPNFGDPGSAGSGTNVLTNPLFGRSTVSLARSLGSGGSGGGFNPLFQIGGPRSVQLALRLNF